MTAFSKGCEVRFGFHVSIAGGLDKVPERAKRLGCQCIQIFSRNPRSWRTKSLENIEIEFFKKQIVNARINPCIVHMPYLPNLSSSQEALLKRSCKMFHDDIERAEEIGAHYLVVHMGSRGTQSEEEAIKVMAESINSVLLIMREGIFLLLENTSGGGRQIGYKFEHFKELLERISNGEKVGICMDIAHAFQSGYDFGTERGLEETLELFDGYLGLDKLHLLHLNDSATPLGSRIDRHWHIGEGYIGKEGFKKIINHPLLSHLPAIMETPRKSDEDDLRNMKIVRNLQKDGNFDDSTYD